MRCVRKVKKLLCAFPGNVALLSELIKYTSEIIIQAKCALYVVKI
jgi:hypothetical protein